MSWDQECRVGFVGVLVLWVLCLGIGSSAAEAGEPVFISGPMVHHPAPVPVLVGPMPTGMHVVPVERNYPYRLGTFAPNPSRVATVSRGVGGVYTPYGSGDLSSSLATYGPLSRFRAVPADVLVYSRGYDGRLYPTTAGTAYVYPGLTPADPNITPTRFRPGVPLLRRNDPRQRFAPYQLSEN